MENACTVVVNYPWHDERGLPVSDDVETSGIQIGDEKFFVLASRIEGDKQYLCVAPIDWRHA